MKIPMALLLLCISLFLNAMEQQLSRENLRSALREEILVSSGAQAAQEPDVAEFAKKKEEKCEYDFSALSSLTILRNLQTQRPYEDQVSCAEALARAKMKIWISNYGSPQIEIPHFGVAGWSITMTDPHMLIDDLKDLVQKLLFIHPEILAGSGVPHLLLTKAHFKCSWAEAISTWPALYVACLGIDRWTRLLMLHDFTDAQFDAHIAEEESKLPRLKDKELVDAQENIGYDRERFALIKSIKNGTFREYITAHPAPRYTMPPIMDECLRVIKTYLRT